jgi:hypothetical protein
MVTGRGLLRSGLRKSEVPMLQCLVQASAPVWRHAIHAVLVALQLLDQMSSIHIPDPHNGIEASGCNKLPSG